MSMPLPILNSSIEKSKENRFYFLNENSFRVIETFDEIFRPAIAQLNQFIPKDNVMQRVKNEGSIYPAKIC